MCEALQSLLAGTALLLPKQVCCTVSVSVLLYALLVAALGKESCCECECRSQCCCSSVWSMTGMRAELRPLCRR